MTKQLKYSLAASLLAAGLGVSAVANAQWNGFYADVGVGLNAATAKFDSAPVNLDGVGRSSFWTSLGAGWRMDGGGWVAGVGAYYDFPKVTITDGNVQSLSTKVEQKFRYGIRGDIGWNPAPPTVIYGILTWNWAKVDASFSQPAVGSSSFSNTHTGFGYGAGIRHMLPGNWYVYAEWQQIDYNGKGGNFSGTTTNINVKPENTIGLIGLGFKF